jgi:hypothetical protein
MGCGISHAFEVCDMSYIVTTPKSIGWILTIWLGGVEQDPIRAATAAHLLSIGL